MSVTYPIIQLEIGGGETLEFKRDEIVTANLVEEIDPLSVTLPINVIDFQIHTSDESFSMFSGDYFSLLSERLPVQVYENIDGENRLMGKFYLETWENLSETEFEFKAVDLLGLLDSIDYDGGFWENATELADILSDVLGSIGVSYSVDETIDDRELHGWIPPGNYREALQQICFAARATVVTARSSEIQILPIDLPGTLADTDISDAEKQIGQKLELLPIVTNIEVVSHEYSQGDTLEDIFEETLDAGNHKIVFEKPYYDIVVDGPGYVEDELVSENGDKITTEDGTYYIEVGGEYDFGPNCLYLYLDSGGTVTITGYPWIDSKRGFSFAETGIEELSNKNTLRVLDATLVSLDNAQDVLDQMRDYYRQRYKQSMTVLPSEIEPNDIVSTNTMYDKRLLGLVHESSIDLTGGFRSKIKIKGIEFVSIYIEGGSYTLVGTDIEMEKE